MHSPRLVVVSMVAALVPVLAGCPGDGDDGGGACATLLPGDLVITEVFADHDAPAGSSGADEGKEWLEIYNASSAAIDLEGLVITHSRPDGSSDHVHTIGAATLAAGDYFVLGNVAPEFVEGIYDYGFGPDLGDFFNTDGGKFTIGCGTDVIDEALYDEVDPGKSTGFDGGATPDYTANDDLVNWCTPPEDPAYEFEQANFGTPGQANFDCEVVVAGQCNDGGTMRPTVPPVPGDLVITEVMPSPSAPQDKKEYIEALVTRDVDLNGLGLARSSTANPNIVASESCLRVTAGTYVVFAKSAVAAENGNLPRVDGVFTFSMVDAGDVQLMMGTTVLDAFVWANAPSSASYNLDPDFTDAGSNDMERYWCTATTTWFAGPCTNSTGATIPCDEGSPGVANEQCTILPAAGQCFDPPGGTTTRAIVPPTAGQLLITELMPQPTSPADKKEWIEIKASAAFDLNGLKIQRLGTTVTTNQINAADCVPITAGGYGLFAKSSVATPTDSPEYNGGLVGVDGVFGSVALINVCDASVNCSLQILTAADVVLDNITWSASTSKKARQLDPDITDTTLNDVQIN